MRIVYSSYRLLEKRRYFLIDVCKSFHSLRHKLIKNNYVGAHEALWDGILYNPCTGLNYETGCEILTHNTFVPAAEQPV